MIRILRSLTVCLCISGFLCSVTFAGSPAAKNRTVFYLVPDDKGSPFWDSSAAFAESCANAVGLKLEIIRIPLHERRPFLEPQAIERALSTFKEAPALLISTLLMGEETQVLELVKRHNMLFISVNTHLTESRLDILGQPRQEHPNWIARMAPDDMFAGYELAKQLIAITRANKCPGKRCPINMLGITGLTYTFPSLQRTQGLRKAVSEDDAVELLGTFTGGWQKHLAAEKLPSLMQRFSNVDAVWSANYAMAEAAIDYRRTHKLSFQLGAVDWVPDALAAANRGDLSVSVGGHYMEAGWAILLFADYRAGFDFHPHLGSIIHTPLSVMGPDFIEERRFLENPQWNPKVLRQFMQLSNPLWREYHLNAMDFVQAHIHGEF